MCILIHRYGNCLEAPSYFSDVTIAAALTVHSFDQQRSFHEGQSGSRAGQEDIRFRGDLDISNGTGGSSFFNPDVTNVSAESNYCLVPAAVTQGVISSATVSGVFKFIPHRASPRNYFLREYSDVLSANRLEADI